MDEIVNSFLKIRNNNEIEDVTTFLKENKGDYPEVLTHKRKLEGSNRYMNEKLENNIHSDHFNILYDKISKRVEMQPWKKIPKYIKNDKIRDYINTLDNIDNPDLYYKEILENKKNKQIKNVDIKYNQDECRIDYINY